MLRESTGSSEPRLRFSGNSMGVFDFTAPGMNVSRTVDVMPMVCACTRYIHVLIQRRLGVIFTESRYTNHLQCIVMYTFC